MDSRRRTWARACCAAMLAVACGCAAPASVALRADVPGWRPNDEARTAAMRCRELRGLARTWGAVAAATSIASGSTGLTAGRTSATTQETMGYVAAGSSVFGAVAVYLSQSYADDFAQSCTDASP